MNIIFFGTSLFAAKILEDLLKEDFSVAAVVTRIDKPQGRRLELLPPPVKTFLIDQKSRIPILQPLKASTAEFEKTLEAYKPDIFVVVAYGEIIKKNWYEKSIY